MSEELREAHRKEARALQNEITRLKKTVTKGDKKKLKTVQTEIEALEASMLQKHKDELAAFEAAAVAAAAAAGATVATEAAESDDAVVETDESESTGAVFALKKQTKAQKRRERKEQDMLQLREEAALEAQSMPDLGRDETEKLAAILEALNLRIFDVPSNGDCLFSAVADQYNFHAPAAKTDAATLRKAAANWIMSHPDDFLPFLTNESGDMMTEDELQKYCDTMEKTAAWGGQHEIRALSSYLELPINVFLANSAPLRTGEEFAQNGAPLVLSYHLHLYALGAHYNSLRPASSFVDDGESDEDGDAKAGESVDAQERAAVALDNAEAV